MRDMSKSLKIMAALFCIALVLSVILQSYTLTLVIGALIVGYAVGTETKK